MIHVRSMHLYKQNSEKCAVSELLRLSINLLFYFVYQVFAYMRCCRVKLWRRQNHPKSFPQN